MDFFGHQEQARKASGRLVWLFVAAVLCIIVLIYVAAKLTLVVATKGEHADPIDWPVLGAVSGLVAVVVGGAMLFKTAQLRSGGGTVAEMLGGRLVDIDPKDPKEKMLRNVVEEMAIASGVPVPEIYVMDREAGINAFAAGWSPADAAVAVTRGSLETFTRDELQGVIAHEFSHVFHGDMRLNIRLMGTLFGILCIAVVGRILMRSMYYSGGSRSNRKGGNAGILLFGVALIVIGYVGVFFARMIQAAVSRQREYLADAAAVQYTRNPRGIGMALAKIGGLSAKVENAHAEEASHMMFADGMSRLSGALATHPPIQERIERVMPGFLKHVANTESMAAALDETPTPAQFAGGAASGFAGAAVAGGKGTAPAALMKSVGDPLPEHVVAARKLLDSLPLDLTVTAHEPERAGAIVYALLLDADDAQRKQQVAMIEADDERLAHEAQGQYLHINAVDRSLRLPLLELTMPALRRLPEPARRRLRTTARKLALADDHLTPFEFALLKTLERHVRIAGEDVQRPHGRPHSLLQEKGHVATVLSAIAHAGAEGDEAKAASAFARGRDALSLDAEIALLPAASSAPQQLDAAINELARVSPFGKRNLIHACAEVAADDGVLDPDEVDLVRALGELWDCPVPLAANDA